MIGIRNTKFSDYDHRREVEEAIAGGCQEQSIPYNYDHTLACSRCPLRLRLSFAIVFLFLLCTFGGAVQVSAQEDASVPAPTGPRAGRVPTSRDEDPAHADMEKDMAKRANKERQAALKRDTDKLLQLSTELKQYVDKSDENMLSLDVINKAEEIE